ncbi:hypothetical protein KPL70_027122 [Citrus sinensis]|nr:hypothetical protein KPL70_027122 [Citrus sinensis]
MAESTMVTDHINTLKTLFSQLTTLGHNIEENERAELLLQSLPDSYDQLIINLINNNLVESLVFDDVAASVLNEESRRKNNENRQARLKSVSLPFCEHCVISKQHRLKFNRSIARIKCILDLIHSDVWESPDISMGGAKYMVTFIDDYSRRCWVYPIKKKSDVFPVFKEYKAWVELESGKKIMCLRTDNGGEYTDGEFLAFCKQEGIQKQFTMAYTPQQNGVAERMNRTLTERIRAMLKTAGLPNSFWAEAAKTACYIVNQSPSTAIGLKTAMEMWTGKPAYYSYLYVFGCRVYVMYNAQERTKLDAKSRRCIFLGYANRVKGYHLWDLTAYKIVISRYVIFIEDQLQRRDENDSRVKEKSETIPVYVENNPKDSDSSEAALEHEEQEPVESEAPEVRRSTQDEKPSTFREALESSDITLLMTAIQEEIEALHKNKTWELVPLPRGKKAIGNKWVYKIKRDGNDQVERYRARLVVKGYAQKEGINFNEIFSSVVRFTTVRVVLAMCATFDLHLKQLEVKTTFLHRELEEEIYMLQPEGPNKDRVQELKVQLAREFEMKDLRPANKILGMQIHRDRNNRKIWLSQKNYLKKILRRFNIQDCKSISTPLPVNFKLSSSMYPSNEAERKEMSQVPYASAVGSLMFAMICTRPDIAQVVGAVSRYMANPGGEHWIAMKRILRYIKGTSDVALFVSWVSKLQTVVALSTTEAEYIAATQSCKEAIWIQRLLEELGHKQEKISVFYDSQSALHIARNPAFHSRARHIGVQYHFIREVVEDGSVDLQKIHTKENLADVLTKLINADKFIWSRSSCGLAET